MHHAHVPLTPWERRGVVLLFVLLLLFGAMTVFRTACLSRTMGDVSVFFRAAWAIRAGEDIYDVTVQDRWHYSYPPLLAILMTPLADPPAGEQRAGMAPFAVSVAVWYMVNLLCLFLATHLLASALEQTSSDPGARQQPPFCRRWWALRLLPILACLVPIGHTLMRGQVNLLVLLLLCAALAAEIRRRRLWAGLFLAGPMCIKIFPAFLALHPLWRRDGRYLLGGALGLFLGLILIPLAVFGPAATVQQYCKLTEVLVLPALGLGTDRSRAEELINVTATDSQSIVATLHNTLHIDRATRPAQAAGATRGASLLLGGAMTLITLLAGRRRQGDSTATVLFFGLLVLNMLFLSPVCHLHYFCLALPLVMGLMVAQWEQRGVFRLGRGLTIVLTLNAVAAIPPQLPGCEILRDCGLTLYGSLLLWSAGVTTLWHRTRQNRVQAVLAAAPARAA